MFSGAYSLTLSGDVFYGATSGKSPCLFAQYLGSSDRLWQVSIDGDPDRILATENRVVLYSRDGTVADGETKIYFYDTQGIALSAYKLPGIPSQAVIAGGQIFMGCRDGSYIPFQRKVSFFGLIRSRTLEMTLSKTTYARVHTTSLLVEILSCFQVLVRCSY